MFRTTHSYTQALEYKLVNLIVPRFTTEDTIEEGIHNIAQEKLKLEQDVTGQEGDPKTKKKDVARLLKVNFYIYLSYLKIFSNRIFRLLLELN